MNLTNSGHSDSEFIRNVMCRFDDKIIVPTDFELKCFRMKANDRHSWAIGHEEIIIFNTITVYLLFNEKMDHMKLFRDRKGFRQTSR